MQKFNSFCLLTIAVITLAFAGCATQPQVGSSTTTTSPMNRNNNNGLASYMH